jgi:hypothetical protein
MTKKVNERFNPAKLYDIYEVAIAVRDRVCGGMPRNPDLIKTWVESTTGFADEQAEKLVQADAELVVNAVAEKSWVGFPEDKEKGLFIPCRNVKAMLKQSASLLRITVQKRGSKQVLAEGLEVKAPDGGDRLYLETKVPTGREDKAIHVMTAAGPRSALKRQDFVERPVLTFQIWVLKTDPKENRHIGEEDIVQILTHAQENGLGASRSQGEGKFDVIEFDKVS